MKIRRQLPLLLAIPLILSGCSFSEFFSNIFGKKNDEPSSQVTNYTVSFEANGGTGEMANMTTSGSTFVAPLCTFSYEGHTFSKWALGRSTGTQYAVGETISEISSDIILFAIWVDGTPTPGPTDNFTVTFDGSGASGTMEAMSTSGSTFVVPENGFTYEDHTFLGWALNSLSGTQYAPGDTITGITSNFVLVALWQEYVPTEGEASEYLAAFNSLKNSILSGHNYTNSIHSFLDGYQEDPDCVVDDEFVMIDDKIVYWNSNLLSGKRGIISQKNQGYIYFDYYGNNVLYDSFYSTRTDVGISSIFDLTVENLFLGNAVQDSTNVAKFTISNTDSIAVAANFTGFSVTFMIAPEDIYFTVSKDKTKLTLHSDFTYRHFDQVEKVTHLLSTCEIHNIGTTAEAKLQSYVDNPTNVFTAPTAWSADDETIFKAKYAGEVPTFVEGLSYTYSVSEFTYEGKYQALLTDLASGDLTSSYAEVLLDEYFEEVESPREHSRLFKRVFTDSENFSKTTYTVEIAYQSGEQLGQEDLFPQGKFQILFHAKTENIDITTIGELNTYLSEKGYTSFIPQFNLPANTKVSHFKDETESKNKDGKYWEFCTSTTALRIYIDDYATASAAVEAYASALMGEPYNFSDRSLTPFGEIRLENKTRYVEDSQVFITIVGESSYASKGYFEVRYQIHKEDDGVVTHHLVGIDIEDPNVDFTVGDDFSFTGVIRAQYSDGNSAIVTSKATFSEYDLTVGGDQQVKVTYEEDGITATKYYSIHVASSTNYSTESFKYAGETVTLTLNLCEDGTGTYIYNRVGTSASAGTFIQYFTYTISGSTITFTLTKQYNTTSFTKFSLFMCEVPGGEGSTRVGTYTESENKIEVETSTTSTDTTHNQHELRTFTLK